jgi:3-deoxy-D-manno-octulosonic acid hydroxylase-like protein
LHMSAGANLEVPFDPERETIPWIEVSDYSVDGWHTAATRSRALAYCHQLEQGEVLFFRRPPFILSSDDKDELVRQPTLGSRLHKNISYRPQPDLLRGYSGTVENRRRVHDILRNYSAQVTSFISRFLTPYAGQLSRDYASFRPVEEEGRSLPLHKRNDLLHVDAFPSRPTRGGRILRVFTNIHPFRDRVWRISGSFSALARRYAVQAGLQNVNSGFAHRVRHWLCAAGMPLPERSPYDRFMLRFHDFLKENIQHQTDSNVRRVAFPPASTWLVFTDAVSHAVLSGRFALEQTFVVPVNALVSPEHSPLRILEKLAGGPLV